MGLSAVLSCLSCICSGSMSTLTLDTHMAIFVASLQIIAPEKFPHIYRQQKFIHNISDKTEVVFFFK